jgi:hypothetical protein
LALVGGYLLRIPSDRKLVMELKRHGTARFVGLSLDQNAWDASTFSQNRRRRFDASGVPEQLFDETVKRVKAEGLVSRQVSADGTLVRANASYKSSFQLRWRWIPTSRLRASDREDSDGPQDPGNCAVDLASQPMQPTRRPSPE